MSKTQPIKSMYTVKKMLKRLQEISDRDALLFRVGIYTSLRISDLVRLQVKDFFTNEGKLRHNWKGIEQKTQKRKTLALADNVRSALKDYIEKYDLEYEDYLFFSTRNPEKHIDRHQAYRRLKDVAEELNIPDFAPHSMRKTIPYLQYRDNKDIALAQKILNHQSPKQTLDYLGIEQENIDQAYQDYDIDF